MFFLDEDQLQLVLTKKPKVIDVLKILAPYDYKWSKIGESLNVKEGFLEGLRESYGRSDSEKLARILQSWIDTRCSDVSWNHIKEVLEGPIMGMQGIAKMLSESVVLLKLIHKSRCFYILVDPFYEISLILNIFYRNSRRWNIRTLQV